MGAISPSSGCSACRSRSSYGGSAGGPVETMIAMEAFGRALALEPYSRDGRARRRLSSPWRQRRAMRRSHPEDRRRQPDPRLRPYRAAIALRPRTTSTTRAVRDGAGWVLDGEKGVVAARRYRRQADRHRAGRRRAARPRRDRASLSSTARPQECRGAATRPRTGCVPRRSRSRMCGSGPKECSVSRGRHCRSSSASSTRRSRRCAPRPSVRWRRCTS